MPSSLASKRESRFLPGVRLDDSIKVTRDSGRGRRAPTRSCWWCRRRRCARWSSRWRRPIAAGTPLIACAKGIEHGTHKFMTEIIAECAPQRGAGDPVRAELRRRRGARPADGGDARRGRRQARAASWRRRSARQRFRPYHSTDVRGVEIGGATKNVLAIAAGIVTGRGLGASASAALTTRGFAELVRFGKAFGAKPETMMGLSGLGDLILTCSSPQSRNFSFGVALGKGEKPDGAAHGKLAEGVFTAPVLLEMAREKNVDMPISAAVAAVLAEKLSVDEAIESLLTRPIKAEEMTWPTG